MVSQLRIDIGEDDRPPPLPTSSPPPLSPRTTPDSSRSASTISIAPGTYFPPLPGPPTSPRKMDSPPPLWSCGSQRLRIGFMLMLGLYTVVSMRLNLSMAVVCMVNATAFAPPPRITDDFGTTTLSPLGITSPHEQPKCARSAAALADNGYNGTFLWSPQMQSLLFSATFYGSLATITVSGAIADRFGPKFILGTAAIIYIIVTLLTPIISEHSFIAYFVSRIVMGLAEGFVFPCLGSMAGRWFPANERSTMAAIYTSGNQLAASLSSVISSTLCASPLGWPSIFYLFGVLGVVWLIGWCVVVTDVPDDNSFISTREALYLRETINRKKKPGRVPWKHMLRSRAVYAALTAQFAYNFTATIMQAFLPTYFRDELMLPLGQNGIYTMIPFLSQMISKNILAILADRLKRKGILGQTQCAVLFQSISCVGSALSLWCLAYFPSCERPWLAAIFLGLYVMRRRRANYLRGFFFSAGIPGFFTSLLSMAPEFSGTMTSLGMTFGSIANILGPILLSAVTAANTPYTWPIVFFTGGALNIIAGFIFMCFGSADVQQWANPNALAKDEEANRKGQSLPAMASPAAVHPLEHALSEKTMEIHRDDASADEDGVKRPKFTLESA